MGTSQTLAEKTKENRAKRPIYRNTISTLLRVSRKAEIKSCTKERREALFLRKRLTGLAWKM